MTAIDTHVHLYSCFDMGRALGFLYSNLGALAAGTAGQRVGLLAERGDCRVFEALVAGTGTELSAGWRVRKAVEECAVTLANEAGGELILVAGRQLVTAERLEVLALATASAPPEGMPVAETIIGVREHGGVPVLAWGLGKWLFSRGRLVARLLATPDSGSVLFGDTALRCGLCGGGLLARARSQGFGVVAGSDPLPVAGEERYLGTCGIVCHGRIDADRPASAVRDLLSVPPVATGWRIAGSRSTVFGAVRRSCRFRLARGGC